MLDLLLVAELEVAHPQLVRQPHRPVDEPVAGNGVVRTDAVGVQVGQTDEEAAEQQAAYVGQRQEAARPLAFHGLQGVHVVVERVPKDGEPAGVAAERRGAPARA